MTRLSSGEVYLVKFASRYKQLRKKAAAAVKAEDAKASKPKAKGQKPKAGVHP
jgi:hypothetical protein